MNNNYLKRLMALADNNEVCSSNRNGEITVHKFKLLGHRWQCQSDEHGYPYGFMTDLGDTESIKALEDLVEAAKENGNV